MKYIPIIGLYWSFKEAKEYDKNSDIRFAIFAISQTFYHTLWITLVCNVIFL